MNENEMPRVTVGPTGKQLQAFLEEYGGILRDWHVDMAKEGLSDDEVTRLIDELATKAGGDLKAVTHEMLNHMRDEAFEIVRIKNLPPNERPGY